MAGFRPRLRHCSIGVVGAPSPEVRPGHPGLRSLEAGKQAGTGTQEKAGKKAGKGPGKDTGKDTGKGQALFPGKEVPGKGQALFRTTSRKRTGTFPDTFPDKQEKDRHFSTLFRTSRKRTGTFPRSLQEKDRHFSTLAFPRSGKGQALFGGFAGDVFWSESFLGGSVFGGASRHPTPTLEHAHVIHSRRSRGTGPGDGSRCPARRTARP